MSAKASPHSRRTVTWIVVTGSLLFVALTIYRSLHVAGYRCSVCLDFRGAQVCRTVEGPTEPEARMGATTNACAYLAEGVTDRMACERSSPTKLDCTALN